MTDKAKIELLEKENEQLKKQLAELPDTLKSMELLTTAKSQYEQLIKETLEIKGRYQSVLNELSNLKKKYQKNFLNELNHIKQAKRR